MPQQVYLGTVQAFQIPQQAYQQPWGAQQTNWLTPGATNMPQQGATLVLQQGGTWVMQGTNQYMQPPAVVGNQVNPESTARRKRLDANVGM
jgi:hypothetical protein